jgi:hypothetical protein
MYIKNFVCDIPDWEKKLANFPEPQAQNTDFIECIRNRQKFALNEINGHRSCTIVNMGTVALQLNRTLEFDPVNELFVNDEEANRLLDHPSGHPGLFNRCDDCSNFINLLISTSSNLQIKHF